MKTKLHSLFIVLALLAGAHRARPASVQIGITPAGQNAVLTWPATLTNYVLQSTTNLTPAYWLTVSNVVPVLVNNSFTVTVTNTLPARFFRLYNTNATTLPTGMVLIPAGSFTMGDTFNEGDSGERPLHTVDISAFYMDINLVTSSQWQTIYNWAKGNGYDLDNQGLGKGPNYPAEDMLWYDAVKWCNARSQKEGLAPVYYTDPELTQIYDSGDVDAVYANWAGKGYRLPTEAEWEKAARGGLSGQRFPWGDTISESQANYLGYTSYFSYDFGPDGYNAIGMIGGGDYNRYTSPVGSFAPNGYGLYDMAGNVYEWCWDWGGGTYADGTDPHGPDSSQYNFRVRRGGCYGNIANRLRCANREGYNPWSSSWGMGFRCVRGF